MSTIHFDTIHFVDSFLSLRQPSNPQLLAHGVSYVPALCDIKRQTLEQQRESSRLRLSYEQAGLVRPIREKSATEPAEEQPPSITALLDWFRPHTAAKSALKWVDE